LTNWRREWDLEYGLICQWVLWDLIWDMGLIGEYGNHILA